MRRPARPLSDFLPPLIFGTATFNYQYNVDPYALHTNDLVQKALAQGVHAFDSSPYYGPAEEILGAALATSLVRQHYARKDYVILTKVGRVSSHVFDYSPAWVRESVRRSCQRLGTTYLDVVYCHDCEFVSPREVLDAVRELRRIRDDEGLLHYVGISGYPVDVLCELAELILRETGEPLDIVQSYANFTLQNTRLASTALPRLVAAGVDVVTNASPLGMGLLRKQGPSVGALGNWHPAPDDLRQACINAGHWAHARGEKIEVVAVRFALENWLREGAQVGGRGTASPKLDLAYGSSATREKLGVSVMGVSNVEELDETMRIWRSVLDGLTDDLDADPGTITPSDGVTDHEWSLWRRHNIRVLAKGICEVIGPQWVGYAWPSPEPGFVNQLRAADPVAVTVSASDDKGHQPHAGILTPPLEIDQAPRTAGTTECADPVK